MRRARTASEARLAELETTVAKLEAARASAVRNLKDADARLVNRATELKAVKARLRELEAEASRPQTSGEEAAPAAADDTGRAAPDLGVVARELAWAAAGGVVARGWVGRPGCGAGRQGS